MIMADVDVSNPVLRFLFPEVAVGFQDAKQKKKKVADSNF